MKIKKVVGAPVRVAPMAGSRPPLSPKKSKSKGRFLRPAIQQVLVLTILTACAYGIVVYLWKQPKPEPGAVSTELPENGIRRATEQEAARVTGALAEPTSGERAQAKASGRPASSWGDQAAFDQAVESIKASREEYKRFSEDQNQSRLDDVETLAREGLDVLERLQKTAPASVNISEQIRKGYESIFNARQSRKLDLSDASSSRPATTPPRRVTEPRAAPPNAGREIEELFSTATPIEAKVPVMTPAPVPLEPAPDFDAQPLGLAEDWNPDQDHSLPEVEDLISVLQAYGTPREVVDAASDMTFPGDIPYRMPIQLAGERLGLPVAGREALQNPALPQRSLLGYRFEGNFGDGMDICLLITDRKGQVVAAQCIRSNPALVPSLPRSLYSDRWSVANLLTGDGPTQDAWKVVHRVRRQNGGVVVDSEAVTPQRFEPRFTSRLYLPSPIVDLLLLRNMPPEEDFEE